MNISFDNVKSNERLYQLTSRLCYRHKSKIFPQRKFIPLINHTALLWLVHYKPKLKRLLTLLLKSNWLWYNLHSIQQEKIMSVEFPHNADFVLSFITIPLNIDRPARPKSWLCCLKMQKLPLIKRQCQFLGCMGKESLCFLFVRYAWTLLFSEHNGWFIETRQGRLNKHRLFFVISLSQWKYLFLFSPRHEQVY